MNNTCKKCNETKDVSFFKKNNRCPKGVVNTCKDCIKKRGLNIKIIRIYKKRTSEKVIEKNKIARLKKENKIKNFFSDDQVKKREDRYFKNGLINKGFASENITPELIEVQRIIIKTKRLCKTSQI